MKRIVTSAALAALFVVVAANVQAQDVPRRCGGLLCDMGMFGGSGSASSSLPCNDFLCRALGGRQAEAAPPPPAAAPMQAEPAPMKHHRKKRVAQADAARSEAMKPAAAPDTVSK